MKETFIYKFRDKSTGLYWTGKIPSNLYSKSGKTWKSEISARRALSYFLTYCAKFKPMFVKEAENWDLVKEKVEVTEVSHVSMSKMVVNSLIIHRLNGLSYPIESDFLTFLLSRNKLDEIKYLVVVEHLTDSVSDGFEYKKEIRQKLKNLKIKPNRYHLSDPCIVSRVFSKEQSKNYFTLALNCPDDLFKVRLALNTKNVVDIDKMRDDVLGKK